MKIKSFDFNKITITPIKDRWYKLDNDVKIVLRTDCGVIVFDIGAGFVFDGRSGGKLVDLFVPNLGTQMETASWLLHDCLAHDIGISFEMTNDILYQMLRLSGYSWIRAKAVHTSVSFSDSWFGQPNGPTPQEASNINLSRFHWYDKFN